MLVLIDKGISCLFPEKMFSLILWCSVGGSVVGKIYNWEYPVIDKKVLGKKEE